jgi:hypothetical protein
MRHRVRGRRVMAEPIAMERGESPSRHPLPCPLLSLFHKPKPSPPLDLHVPILSPSGIQILADSGRVLRTQRCQPRRSQALEFPETSVCGATPDFLGFPWRRLEMRAEVEASEGGETTMASSSAGGEPRRRMDPGLVGMVQPPRIPQARPGARQLGS